MESVKCEQYNDALSHSFFSSSVVLMTSKGRLVTRGAWTKALERLGADKGIKLKGNYK